MLSKTEWEAVEKNIMSGVGVTLQVDGLKVTYRLGRLKNQLKLAIWIIADGATVMEWHDKDCPERRLFFRPYTTSAWTTEARRMIAKMSKSEIKRRGIDPGKKLTAYYPWWTQFEALKKHLTRNATTIEVLWPEA